MTVKLSGYGHGGNSVVTTAAGDFRLPLEVVSSHSDHAPASCNLRNELARAGPEEVPVDTVSTMEPAEQEQWVVWKFEDILDKSNNESLFCDRVTGYISIQSIELDNDIIRYID